ncbi:MAG: DUF4124 domain-containing protein [Syntrophorhabdaceae bacterium]|nr:DUF4124 domain-containing protein [Syntrophorhabdaceae bacterium]
MKKILLLCGCALFVLCVPMISPIIPNAANADIFQWKDDNGTVHFTDAPTNIPPKYRASQKKVLRTPSDSGLPGLTIIESPPKDLPPIILEPPPMQPTPSRQASSQAQADQLQARISAKEKFIESIDLKRSHALNPLGNRFVSPEDQELYNKYSEELPRDRQQLRELQSNKP